MAVDRRLALTPDASSHTTDADRLIHQLENQLRRQLTGIGPSVDLAEAGRRWAARMHDLLPAAHDDIRDVGAALQAIDPLPGTARYAGISQAMRLLARLRSGAPDRSPIPNTMAARTPPPASINGATRLVAPPAYAPPHPAPSVARRQTQASARPQPGMPQSQIAPAAAASPGLPTGRAIKATNAGSHLTGRRKSDSTKPAGIARASRPKSETPGSVTLQSPIQDLPRFDRRYGDALEKMGIRQVGDLLTHYPRRYVDYSQLLTVSQLRPGMEVTVEVRVLRCEAIGPYNRPGRRVEAVLADPTGSIRAVWFRQEWITKQLKAGMDVYLSGKVEYYRDRLQFTSPSFEAVSEQEAIHTGRLVPFYSLSGALKQNWLRARMKWVVDELAHTVEDPLPDAFRRHWSLLPLHEATQQVHFPDDESTRDSARKLIAFQEALIVQLGLLRLKQEWQATSSPSLRLSESRLSDVTHRLPFTLTEAQNAAIREILMDISHERPMSRILKGDVGSGKTVVAALAMFAAVENGYQAVMMAPTEVLAEQHSQTLAKLFAKIDPLLQPVLITGSLGNAAKDRALGQVATGQGRIIVGTHALFEKRAVFHRLALVVIDEQHRFGSKQRDALHQKGGTPHLLTMTGTVIPRTLSLAAYADYDVTSIDAKPVGRLPIKTRTVLSEKRDRVYDFLAAQTHQGRQAYLVCPVIEDDDAIETRAAKAEFAHLSDLQVFTGVRLALVHGKMKPAEKEMVMRRFRDHEVDLLIATTVIEVGIDIPNATVMVIEDAEHFGLAQLHQLRGRVGRGDQQSYCILVASDGIDDKGLERLHIVESTNDGIQLAEADLKLRKQGAFFGQDQSGARKNRQMRIATMLDLPFARERALELLQADPLLTRSEHRLLANRVDELWTDLPAWH